LLHNATLAQETTSPQPPADPAVPMRRRGLQQHKLHVALCYIEDRIGEPIGVRDLAAQLHMSPFHFARRFKQAVGHPPHAYITQVRIERAKRLLASSTLPLVNIAMAVGYRTQAHFTGVFHKTVGSTPRTYRLMAKRDNPEGA
jgi:AraC family transcriptional regulator